MKKTKSILVMLSALFLFGACTEKAQKEAREEFNEEVADLKEDLGMVPETDKAATLDFTDRGGEPYSVDIEKYTEANQNFRTTIWTGTSLQLTLMSIPVGGDIGVEVHNEIEQFIRLESGKGEVYFGDTQETMQLFKVVEGDDIIIIPKGKWHNIKNIGDEPMKLYSIYSPVEHAKGSVHVTMEEGQAADHHH